MEKMDVPADTLPVLGANGVGSGHTGAGVTSAGAKGMPGASRPSSIAAPASVKMPAFSPAMRTLGSRSMKLGLIFDSGQLIEFCQHGFIVAASLAVDGEHTGSLADADGVDARQHIMNIAGQSGNVGDIFYMRLPI